MRKLEDQTGVTPPSTDYPSGKITDGITVVGEGVNGDIVEFFQKLVRLAGITENEDPDNETNGHQLIEALDARIISDILEGDWTYIDDVEFENGWINSYGGDNRLRYRKEKSGLVHVFGVLNRGFATGSNFFDFPAGFRPAVDWYFPIVALAGGLEDMTILSTGQANISTTGNTRVYINVRYPID
jgi:hypothetical protein